MEEPTFRTMSKSLLKTDSFQKCSVFAENIFWAGNNAMSTTKKDNSKYQCSNKPFKVSLCHSWPKNFYILGFA